MKARCHCCGTEKDRDVPEVYPYPDDGITTDRPIDPLWEIDCAPSLAGGEGWREATVCHRCFHELDQDVWTCREHWDAGDPAVPFAELPLLEDDPT